MKHTPTPWTLGVILKRSQTAYIDALHYDPDLMHQDWEGMIECCGCHDSPHKGIEKAEVNVRFIVKAVNHHDRLLSALKETTAQLIDEITAKYPPEMLKYPSNERSYMADMAIVRENSKLIKELEQTHD